MIDKADRIFNTRFPHCENPATGRRGSISDS